MVYFAIKTSLSVSVTHVSMEERAKMKLGGTGVNATQVSTADLDQNV